MVMTQLNMLQRESGSGDSTVTTGARQATQDALAEQLGFLPVPAGTVKLGLDAKIAEKFINSYGEMWADFFHRETPQHDVGIDAFELARYPVTNAIYAQFMADGGYQRVELWTPDGWA